MRYAIVMWLCACASITSARHQTAAEVKANYVEFYKEFMAGHYGRANAIASQKKVNRQMVVDIVLAEMSRHIRNDLVVLAKIVSRDLELDRATETAFAQNTFDLMVKSSNCWGAADVAFYFDLGPAYADRAINCGMSVYEVNKALLLACNRSGTPELISWLTRVAVEDFKHTSPDHRDYDSITEISKICSLTAEQYLDLFAISIADQRLYLALEMIVVLGYAKNIGDLDLQPLYRRLFQAAMATPNDGNLKFVQEMFKKDGFKKISADYDNFIAVAVERFNCGLAMTVAIERKLPDAALEAIFLNPKCSGAVFDDVELELIPPKRAGWFLDLSLQAGKFFFARKLVDKFSMGDSDVNRIVDEALAAKALDQVMDFDPPSDQDKRAYQDSILDRIMDADEEHFVVRFAVSCIKSQCNVEENWHGWIERAYLHALRRGAFELAAEIAGKYDSSEFSQYGVNLAFDQACQAKNLDEAELIVRRFKLGRKAMDRVVILRYQIKKAEERKKWLESRKRQERACQKSGDWNVARCR